MLCHVVSANIGYVLSFGPAHVLISSGINAVLYYSNDILSKSLPDLGPYVSVGITVINVIMTFPPIVLIEVLQNILSLQSGSDLSLENGQKISLAAICCGFCALIGYSWVQSGRWCFYIVQCGNHYIRHVSHRVPYNLLSLTCDRSFAVGLGPIPFVMIPEVSPPQAVSALSSIALSLNCEFTPTLPWLN